MIQNGGFEAGNLSGWESVGDVSVQTASFGTLPKQGSYQALLTTFHSMYHGHEPFEPALPLSGNDPVSYSVIESFLGLPDQFLNSLSIDRRDAPNAPPEVTSGSAIKQQFQAQAGSSLTVHYNFLTDGGWGNANDFSFVSLISEGVLLGFILAGVESPDRQSNTVLAKETGYRRLKLAIPFTGQYTLGIGVVEMLDEWTGSAICVDKVAVVRSPWCAFNLRKNDLGKIIYKDLKRDPLHIHAGRSDDGGRRGVGKK